jgi:hypothetical protein
MKGFKNARKQTADQVVCGGKVKLNRPYLAASAGLGASVVVAVTVAAFFASRTLCDDKVSCVAGTRMCTDLDLRHLYIVI